MKKVLIIAFSFPPASNIGAQRPYKLAKYLSKFGWKPIVLTPKIQGERPEGIELIETEFKDITRLIKSKAGLDSVKGVQEQLGSNLTKDFKYPTLKSKIIKLAKEIILYPDAKKGWYKYALEAASNYLSKVKVDAIISTSGPVTSHLIANKLKQRFSIPWVADFRDLWTQNPYHNKFAFIRYFEKRLELKTLLEADAIVTVTIPWIDTLKNLHNKNEVCCITNGFDKDDFPDLPVKLTDKFTITYTGALYNGKRDPSTLFKIVSQLIKEGKINKDLIELNFYGPKEGWLIEEIKENGLTGVVNLYGYVLRNEALKRQRESQLLLLLLWDNKNEEGFCPGKIYEYFGSRRPIIAIGWHRSIVRDLFKKTDTGKFASNEDELKSNILDYYKEFIKEDEIKFRGNSNIRDFTYEVIAKKYSEILNSLVSQ